MMRIMWEGMGGPTYQGFVVQRSLYGPRGIIKIYKETIDGGNS